MLASPEFLYRRGAIAARLPELKAQALLVSSLPNVRYLTGFTGSNGILLLLEGDAVFLTDPRYSIQAGREVSCKIKIVQGLLTKAASDLIARKKLTKIGFEQAHLSFANYIALKDELKLAASLVPIPDIILDQRMVKSESEIAAIRAAVLLNSQAFEQALKKVRVGASEADIAAEIDYRMRRLGASGSSFETIVAAGARTALPHARPTAARLQPNDLLLIDMGATLDGYASDMTRVVSLGKPPAKIRNMYRAVLESQLAAIAIVKPGIAAGRVDLAARKVLRGHNLDKQFVHSTGHGLGLEIHEPPRLGKAAKTRLQAGMVITIEPGAYIEGLGGIRIEDTVLVTKTGCEVLTPTSKELVEL